MDTETLGARFSTYLNQLETTLLESFAAQGRNLPEMFSNVESDLPVDIRDLYQTLSHYLTQQNGIQATDMDDSECIFLCGQLLGRLHALANQRAADSLMASRTEGLTPEEFTQTDLTAVARFIAVRDKIMRRVADFTLKALLILAGLLAIGLLLGLI